MKRQTSWGATLLAVCCLCFSPLVQAKSLTMVEDLQHKQVHAVQAQPTTKKARPGQLLPLEKQSVPSTKKKEARVTIKPRAAKVTSQKFSLYERYRKDMREEKVDVNEETSTKKMASTSPSTLVEASLGTHSSREGENLQASQQAALGPNIRAYVATATHVTVVADSPVGVVTSAGKTIATFGATQAMHIVCQGGQVLVNDKAVGEKAWIRTSRADVSSTVTVNGAPYRGDLQLRAVNGAVEVVNVLPLEAYLYGVVPAEAVPSWPMAALEAQAVAARTYALYSMRSPQTASYDVDRSWRSQMYDGKSRETARTTEAVDRTRGIIMTYQGSPITAVFHSDAGGYTDDSGAVWGNPVPYLRGVAEVHRDTTRETYHWVVTMDRQRLEQALRSASKSVGTLERVELSELVKGKGGAADRTTAGRVKTVTFVGSERSLTLTGQQVREILGLKSTFFTIQMEPTRGGRYEVVEKTVTKTVPVATVEEERVNPVSDTLQERIASITKGKTDKRSVNTVKKEQAKPLGNTDVVVRKVGTGVRLASQEEAKARTVTTTVTEKVWRPAANQPVRIEGYGFGHGLGLSQWGAADMAKQADPNDGEFYKKILLHYYTGVTITRQYP